MNFKSHKKLLDIEWYEGPMMTLFTDPKGELFIYKWVKANPDSHTWLVFRTTHAQVAAYVQKAVSERPFISGTPFKSWYLVDINPSLEFSNLRQLGSLALEQTVLPEYDTFFSLSDCPEPERLLALVSPAHELMAA